MKRAFKNYYQYENCGFAFKPCNYYYHLRLEHNYYLFPLVTMVGSLFGNDNANY